MFLTKSISKFMKLMVLTLSLCVVASCGIYKKTDARKVPTSGMERAKKNIEEGRSFKLFDSNRNKGGGVFEFASSNELWRASLDTIDFMPLASVNYSGGIIITDWYSTNQNSNESIKISIRFLTNEIRADALDIKVFNKKCITQSNCVTSEKEGDINNELKTKILKTATKYKIDKKQKDSKP